MICIHSLSNAQTGSHNDVWRLQVSDFTWTWWGGGVNQRGTYGVKGLAAPANIPGSRHGHSMANVLQTGSVVVFGGYEYTLSGMRACRTTLLFTNR